MPARSTKAPRTHTRLPLGASGAQALGAQIREARLAADMRIEDLSVLSGVHRSQISRIERGIAVTLTPTARRLCECLSIPLPVDATQGKAVSLSARVAALVHAYPGAAEQVARALDDIERTFGPVSPKDRRKGSKAP